MSEFIIESQGTNTFLIYQFLEKELDTFSYGMISNNKIYSVIPIILTQMNDEKYLKYNITSKINLKQYFSGVVNRTRLLNVFLNIADALIAVEEYMLDSRAFILDIEYIYVNVSNGEVSLIYLPVLGEVYPIDIGKFYKELIFSTQFDPSENTDYVTKIINFLNGSNNFSIDNFKKLLEELKNLKNPPSTPIPVNVIPTATVINPVPMQKDEDKGKNKITNSNDVSKNIKSGSFNEIDIQIPENEALKKMQTTEEFTKKSSLFSFFNKSSEKKEKNKDKNKEKHTEKKKEKEIKPEKNTKQSKVHNVPDMNISIPGMSNKNSSDQNALQIQTNKKEKQVFEKKNKTLNQVSAYSAATSENFGETTVLSGQLIGETTVLSEEVNTQGKRAYLIRIKTNEKIMINKPVFHIGKESSYVDYFIGDNGAISRSHASLIQRNGLYYLMDTNSTNHTYIDGNMISSNIEVLIDHGTAFKLANEEFEFRLY